MIYIDILAMQYWMMERRIALMLWSIEYPSEGFSLEL